MTDRARLLAHLGAERLTWLTAKHRALLRGNSQAFKQAVEELQRINRAILACGPEDKGQR
ncbi:hypothetical protein [Pseudogemmobacter faecipullorum]|uniref:Transposase n=1 Tax=Pseudogemmobacter faecipullorum TaxID=2755041 RepID=A0ABS8CR03_9RHOB|nr:hypothetical protein [Pseudogemmobacter faecipullorum]MCB5411806.1 hypothetical protein [Pseudogemmobacter faecipullorum]